MIGQHSASETVGMDGVVKSILRGSNCEKNGNHVHINGKLQIDSAELDLLPEVDDLMQINDRDIASVRSSFNEFSKSQRDLFDGKKGSPALEDALKRLESDGLIDVYQSPSDNAVRILRSVLCRNLEDMVKASIVYALHVLESDLTQATVPVGLRMSKLPPDLSDHTDQAASVDSTGQPSAPGAEDGSEFGSTTSSEHDGVVFDWLLSSYTPIKPAAKKARTFKSVVQGIKFTFGVRDAYGRGGGPTVPHHFNLGAAAVERQVAEALEGVDDWEWDVMRLRDASGGRPLQALGWHVLHHWDLVARLGLDPGVVRKWLAFVESLYVEAPYHCAAHAADALQAVHHSLLRGGGARLLCTTRIFALLLSAMIHDAGHDGCNNGFHQVRARVPGIPARFRPGSGGWGGRRRAGGRAAQNRREASGIEAPPFQARLEPPDSTSEAPGSPPPPPHGLSDPDTFSSLSPHAIAALRQFSPLLAATCYAASCGHLWSTLTRDRLNTGPGSSCSTCTAVTQSRAGIALSSLGHS